MTTQQRERMCTKCKEVKSHLDFSVYPDTCSTCVANEIKSITEFRRQGTVNRSATRLPVAEDLVTVMGSRVGSTVVRLLDALAGLSDASSANRSKSSDPIRTRTHHPGMPRFEPAWADHMQIRADEKLWEMAEELSSFLNRPTDPKRWAGCERCGRQRHGEGSYCQECGHRILSGSRRCRIEGCPNHGYRRADCPKTLTAIVDGDETQVPHP